MFLAFADAGNDAKLEAVVADLFNPRGEGGAAEKRSFHSSGARRRPIADGARETTRRRRPQRIRMVWEVADRAGLSHQHRKRQSFQ
ncbi:hypothetical protein [Phreatobacter cathodiphilus]|uniref:hypothetical protein n=1 Tax=Phreatobacter cathodiphilus TaxID=1868589 RepID=UPI0011B22B6C|nr:hypothetical protein [Phreatobacter cathodiphilus]